MQLVKWQLPLPLEIFLLSAEFGQSKNPNVKLSWGNWQYCGKIHFRKWARDSLKPTESQKLKKEADLGHENEFTDLELYANTLIQ